MSKPAPAPATSKSPRLLIIAGIGGVLLVAVALWAMFGRGSDQPSAASEQARQAAEATAQAMKEEEAKLGGPAETPPPTPGGRHPTATQGNP